MQGDGMMDQNYAKGTDQSQYSGYKDRSGQQIQQRQHDWEELDDRYNMIDEDKIEPDFFIDRPVSE